MLYFDVDDVVRNLADTINPNGQENWDDLINGLTCEEVINQNQEILSIAEPTKYYNLIKQYGENHTLYFLSHQNGSWRSRTTKWLDDHFKYFVINYVNSSDDKLKFLRPHDILIDDSPKFSNYKQIALIEKPYNKCIIESNIHKPFCIIRNESDLNKLLEKYI